MREMKDSGIEWIGEYPEHWEIKRISSCFKERNEKVSDYDWEPLSVTKQGIVKQLETAAKSDAHDARKKVCKNDFVINSRSDRKQSCGVSSYDGSVSLINIVLEPKYIYPGFVDYLLNNYGFAEEFYRYGSGIVADLWSTNYQKMKKIMIPIPPLKEQIKIANFLDEKLSDIDNAIEKTKETIEDYKKYKQAIITKTVTKGLDENAEMKTMGYDNLNKIPIDWAFKPLKYHVMLNAKSLTEKTDENYKFKYVEIGSVSLEDGVANYEYYLFKNAPSRARRIVKRGDIIVSTVRTYLKAIAIIDDAIDTIVSTGFAVLEPHDINKKYLGWVLKSDFFTDLISARSNGISYPAINSSDLVNLKIPVPNKMIQSQIANFLEEKCNEIDNLIKAKEKIITELGNYKKSVIYEYVTGKKEVK